MPEIALKLRIYGRVQRVSYRDWTIQTARALGVDGWVRNRADGSVEALVVGEENQVRALIAKCYEGSSRAKVERVEEEPTNEAIARGEFVRKPTV